MNIGDCVCSNIVNTIIGRITKMLPNDYAIVVVGKTEILAKLEYWHKVEE